MHHIPLSIRARSFALGLGDLVHEPNCKGYANCCACPACLSIANTIMRNKAARRPPFDAEGNLRPRPTTRQPWEPDQAA